MRFGLNLHAPELLFSELEKHKADACARAKISGDTFDFAMKALKGFVESVPDEFWQSSRHEAAELLPGHPKDIPYLALALKLGCPVWSNEKKLKKQPSVKILSAKELLELVGYEQCRFLKISLEPIAASLRKPE